MVRNKSEMLKSNPVGGGISAELLATLPMDKNIKEHLSTEKSNRSYKIEHIKN